MQTVDLPRVAEIEAAGQAFPWTLQIFTDCLRVHYPSWVLEIDGQVQAFLIVLMAAQECHILDIAVAPEYQGQGLASRLLTHLEQEAKVVQVHTFFLEVRASNIAAIHLYKKAGFTELSRRKDYYPATQGREDAIIFHRHFMQ